MNPLPRVDFVAGIVAAILVCQVSAASAAQAESNQVDVKPNLSATVLYEQALKCEEEQAGVRAAAWHVYSSAYDARGAARRLHDALKALQDNAQALKEAFERVSKAALQAEQAKRAALTASTAYKQASAKVLRAAAAFAEARGKQRVPLARAADVAAAHKAQALQQSQTALGMAISASDSLRYALASVGYRSAQLNAGLAPMRATADAFAVKGGEFADVFTKSGQKISSAEVMAASSQLAVRAVQLRDEADVLAGRLRLVRDLSNEMERMQDQEPAHAAALQAYFEAELNAVIEADASSFVAAVRKASLKRCKHGSACRMRLDRELAEAEQLRVAARAEAAERLRVAAANIDATAGIGRRIGEYAEIAGADPQTVDAAVANADAAEALTDKVREAAFNDYQRAQEAYAQAKQAADAAYLTAYGEPRPVAKEETTMAAPASARGAERSASMAAQEWQVEVHAWEFFTAAGGESKGYGAYTYVLFGRRVGSQLAPQVRQSYAALLDAIIASTPHRTEISPNIPHNKLNLFCIPGRTAWDEGLAALDEGSDKFPALDNYASGLALSTLSTAGSGAVRSREILGVIQDSPGPFLLTTLQPMHQVNSGSPMLFVDFSRFPPETYADLVTAYKRALVARPPQGQQTWQPPAFQWVAVTGTDVAGHLGNVINAVSEWFSLGEAKPVKTALH